jgi:hypothetical protein
VLVVFIVVVLRARHHRRPSSSVGIGEVWLEEARDGRFTRVARKTDDDDEHEWEWGTTPLQSIPDAQVRSHKRE